MPYVNEDCSYCGGSGYIVHYGGMENTKETCNRCNGKGYITHFESISDSSSSSYDSSSSSSSYTPTRSGSPPKFNYAGDEKDFEKIMYHAYDLMDAGEFDKAIDVAQRLANSFTWEKKLVDIANSIQSNAERRKADAEADASRGTSSSSMFSAVSIPANASANELSKLANDAYTAKDYVKAVALWLKAEEKGSTNIAKDCYSWTLVEVGNTALNAQNYVGAFELYRKAADLGNIWGMWNAGVCYEKGQGVAKDTKKSYEWYKKAAAQGHEKAQKFLTEKGVKWESGGSSSASANDEAPSPMPSGLSPKLQALYKAAENGDANAQWEFAEAYFHNEIPNGTRKEAIYWCTKAAENGHADAQCNLGCHYQGRDNAKAIYWFEKAAAQGDEYSKECLAELEAEEEEEEE